MSGHPASLVMGSCLLVCLQANPVKVLVVGVNASSTAVAGLSCGAAQQEADRAELGQLRQAVASERDSLEAAAAALQEQQQQQAAAAADLSAREAALDSRAASLHSQAAAVQAAQAAALNQLDSLEANLKSKLEGQQKQVLHGAGRHECQRRLRNGSRAPIELAVEGDCIGAGASLLVVVNCPALLCSVCVCVLCARCRSC